MGEKYFPNSTKFWGPSLGECFVAPNRERKVFTSIWFKSHRPDLMGVCKKPPNYLPYREAMEFIRQALLILLEEEGFTYRVEGRFYIVERM